MRWLAATMLATTVAACSHAPGTSSARRWNASCLARRGCPPAAVPPTCPAQLTPLPIDEAVAHLDELDGAEVAVHGPLEKAYGTCTLLACYSVAGVDTDAGGLAWRYRAPAPREPHAMATLAPETFTRDRVLLAEGGCCNSCGAALALGGIVWLEGPHLFCGGDESQMCCGVEPHGQDVVARGVLRHRSSVPTIEGASLCTLPRR